MVLDSMTLTRDELGLPPLSLNEEEDGYRVVGDVSPGSSEPLRVFAPAVPWVHGQRPLHSSRSNAEIAFTIVVKGATAQQLDNRSRRLEEACEQLSAVWTYVMNGVSYSYEVYMLQAAMGAGTSEHNQIWERGLVRVYTVTGPRNPTRL